MRLSFAALFAALLLLPMAAVAHADSFQVFNLTGTLVVGSVTGTVTLDQTTGMFTSESSLFITSDSGNIQFDEYQTTTGSLDGFTYAQFQNGLYTAYIEINLPSLIGYQGGSICTTTATCPGGHASILLANNGEFTSGSLAPVAPANPLGGALGVAPEPSSLVLIGTGVLGVAGVARRRFFKA